MLLLTILITLPIFSVLQRGRDRIRYYACNDAVYCNDNEEGSRRNPWLLQIVQRAGLFPDSKTFVDMTQINEKQITLQNFDKMMWNTNRNPSAADVKNFVDRNFKFQPESDQWTPPDYSDSPAFLDRIRDNSIKIFAKNLVTYWTILGRKTKKHVKRHPDRHSLWWVPNGFIIPGGRFREQTYLDSYWIIKGLLLCEMNDTVKGMLSNFVYLLKAKFGLIAKGARIYYSFRTHPPLFAAMTALYIEQTNDIEWLNNNIDAIVFHYDTFLSDRNVTIKMNNKKYLLARYGSVANLPRPEHFMEDTTACAGYKEEWAQWKCLSALKSGGDTGWDYSTRWMYDDDDGTNATLSKSNVMRTIPVDLNAIFCQAARIISDFYGKLGNKAQKENYFNLYKQRLRDMEEVFYNYTDGMWYDLDMEKNKHRRYFYASNFAPLWTDCINSRRREYHGQRAVEYIHSQGADIYQGGVPTSLHREGDENWDFPNAWPPLQDIVVTGLYNSGNLEAKKLAEMFANRYISSSVKAWISTEGSLYDKYSVTEPGMPGTGGDYPVQIGYGWSIGVALSFIETFVSSAIFLKSLLSPLCYITVNFSVITLLRKLLFY